jgi:hypothetical protein
MKMNTFQAIVILMMLTMSCVVLAQEQLQNETQDASYMFVQSANSGSFIPVEGNESLYNLTLMGVSPQTIAFSDRPERIVGQVPMQKFLDGMCFGPQNPPNAAIVILDAKEDEDVAVVELFNPLYDAANQTLRYTARILEQANHSYAEFNERNDKKLPATFGPSAAFIDDCNGCYIWCGQSDGIHQCGSIFVSSKWCWAGLACYPIYKYDHYGSQCAQKYGSNCGTALQESCGYSEECGK